MVISPSQSSWSSRGTPVSSAETSAGMSGCGQWGLGGWWTQLGVNWFCVAFRLSTVGDELCSNPCLPGGLLCGFGLAWWVCVAVMSKMGRTGVPVACDPRAQQRNLWHPLCAGTPITLISSQTSKSHGAVLLINYLLPALETVLPEQIKS